MSSASTSGDVLSATAVPAPLLAVELRGITKRFPGVVANDRVDLAVHPNEIHAVVGENGAGKSTLMKILYGIQRPDEGEILVDGSPAHFRSAKDAIAAGIGMVHQHFQLMDNLTVLENVILGAEPRRRGLIDFSAARRRLQTLGEQYGLDVDPDVLVENLPVGTRQRIEILKVLYRGASILILDEPTAVLVPQEVEELFVSLRELTAQGVTIIFINHKLDEVLAAADRITVIRAGRTIATVLPGDVDAHSLAELMVGEDLPTPDTQVHEVGDERALEITGLTFRVGERSVLDDVSLLICRGEIVGVAGVEGNGQQELVEAIIGVIASDAGTVVLGDRDITAASTRDRRDQGIGLIPPDRTREGLLLDAPLWENVALGHQTQLPFSRRGWLDRGGTRVMTQTIVDGYDVRTPSIDVSAHALSGGNQQKLIVGRELAAAPVVLIAAQPTRGIDVGAQAAVWERLRETRAAGMGVLLISADLEELIGLSDTLLVMLRGRITARLDPATLTPEVLGAHMTGVATDGAGT